MSEIESIKNMQDDLLKVAADNKEMRIKNYELGGEVEKLRGALEVDTATLELLREHMWAVLNGHEKFKDAKCLANCVQVVIERAENMKFEETKNE